MSAQTILLFTDGDSSTPVCDKARTLAILSPPDCDPGALGQTAERVVAFTNLG